METKLLGYTWCFTKKIFFLPWAKLLIPVDTSFLGTWVRTKVRQVGCPGFRNVRRYTLSGVNSELAWPWEWVLTYILSPRYLPCLIPGALLCILWERLRRIVQFLCVVFKDPISVSIICITLIIWDRKSLLGNKLFCIAIYKGLSPYIIEFSHRPYKMDEATTMFARK